MNKTGVSFRFPVKVDKSQCWDTIRQDGTREAYVVAVASSDTLDSYWEYFAVTALNDMVGYARERKESKPEEGLVELRETHWSTFAIGTIVDGYIRSNSDTKAIEFWIVIKLKMDYPAARELFSDVTTGVVDKQLSVGGWIDFGASEDAYEVEWQKFISEESDNAEIEVLVGKINRFILEHAAVTLQGFAANDDTRFIEGMIKSFKDLEFQEKMHNQKNMRNTNNKLDKNRISIVERVTQLVSETTEELKSFQRSHEEEHMGKPLEAAKAFLKSLVGQSEEEVSEVLRESGLADILANKTASSDETTEKTTTSPEGAEDSNKESESTTEEANKTEDNESEVAKSNDTESENLALKAIEDLTAQIMEIKSKLDDITSEDDSSEQLKSFVDSTMEAFTKLNGRLTELEATGTVAKGATYEQGEDLARDKSLNGSDEENSPRGLWI